MVGDGVSCQCGMKSMLSLSRWTLKWQALSLSCKVVDGFKLLIDPKGSLYIQTSSSIIHPFVPSTIHDAAIQYLYRLPVGQSTFYPLGI